MRIIKLSLILTILFISSISVNSSYLELNTENSLNETEWSDVIPVSTSSDSQSYLPSIAVDSKGILHTVWYDNSDILSAGVDPDIFYRSMNTTSGEWNDIVLISSTSDQPSYDPVLAIDSDDNIFVLWDDSSDIVSAGTDRDILMRSYNSTTELWNSIELISTESDGHSYRPYITIDSNDNLDIVWYDISDIDSNGVDNDIFYKSFDRSTSTWSTTMVISDISTSSSSNPEIITYNSDKYILWIDSTDIDALMENPLFIPAVVSTVLALIFLVLLIKKGKK